MKTLEGGKVLASLPRYQEFTSYAATLSDAGISFEEIAGNRGKIVVSIVAPVGLKLDLSNAETLMVQPILTEPGKERLVLATPVRSLSNLLQRLDPAWVRLEHIYDY